jgi:hypothetical protein
MATKYSYPAQGYANYNSDSTFKVEEIEELVPKKTLLVDRGNNCIKTRCVYFLFTVLLTVPFIIVDTYFAYTNFSCQKYYIPGINITLDIWLKVIAYASILSIISEMFVIFFEKFRDNTYYNILNFSYIVLQIFIIGWMVFGAYIYWHNYGNSDVCSTSFNRYMWIRLIAGLAGCALKLYTIYIYR